MSILYRPNLFTKSKTEPTLVITKDDDEDDIDDIEDICDTLKKLWKEHPKLNLGQILISILKNKKSTQSFYKMPKSDFLIILKRTIKNEREKKQ